MYVYTKFHTIKLSKAAWDNMQLLYLWKIIFNYFFLLNDGGKVDLWTCY